MKPTILLLYLQGRSRKELRSHFTEQSKCCHLVIPPGTALQKELLQDQEHLLCSSGLLKAQGREETQHRAKYSTERLWCRWRWRGVRAEDRGMQNGALEKSTQANTASASGTRDRGC